MPEPLTIEAAKKLAERREIRHDLVAWARACGFEPATHHRLILTELTAIEEGAQRNLLIMLPPGSAKSTYTSLLFPPHFLGRRPGSTVLACSYSYTLIESFSRKARNLIQMKHKELGYNLCADSRSAGEWETTNGGRFFCAGVNAGIAGHRADLGLIDDPIGTEEDAYSDLYREKVKDWYLNDFWPRLKPGASQILICNRRHEDDLAGWLMATQPEKWKVIKIPFFAQADDPLGRLPGERLWPEWFTEDMAETIRHHPNRAGLYDQDPHPEDGDFFKKDWIESAAYRPEELPHDLIHYVASDFAVSLDQKADFTCHLPGGVDENGVLWILPDIFWKQAATDDSIEAMLAMMKRRRPQVWWAEKGHISKSIGPFLTKRMREEQVYTYVEEVTPARDKRTRAQSIRARMKCGMVRWPTFAHWFPSALAEMLAFDSGKHDDFVDALAHLGMGLDTMISANKQQVQKTFQPFTLGDLTLRWLKQHDKRSRFSREMQLADL